MKICATCLSGSGLSRSEYFPVLIMHMKISWYHCFWQLNKIPCVFMLYFIIHSLTKECLGCYQLLSIVNTEAKKIHDQECIKFNVESFGHMNRGDIVGSWIFTLAFGELSTFISIVIALICNFTNSELWFTVPLQINEEALSVHPISLFCSR